MSRDMQEIKEVDEDTHKQTSSSQKSGPMKRYGKELGWNIYILFE